MPAYLISLDGQADIPIDRVLIVVGRHHLCDARIVSGQVSRRHCCLALDGDGILVRDLGSTNGTRINGNRIDVGILRLGDELQIAQARYLLLNRDGGPSEPNGPAPGGNHPTALSPTIDADGQEEVPTSLSK